MYARMRWLVVLLLGAAALGAVAGLVGGVTLEALVWTAVRAAG